MTAQFRRAKVGGPPVGWDHVEILDAKTGEKIDDRIIEADADEGWYVAYTDDPPVGGQLCTKRVERDIKIVGTKSYPRRSDGGYPDDDVRTGVVISDPSGGLE